MMEVVRPTLIVYRNRANWISGWLLALSLLMMTTIVTDPLNVARSPANDMGFGWFGFSVIVIGIAAAAVLFRLFAIPAVWGDGSVLTVRNPLREWTISINAIEGTDESLTYVRVHVVGRKIVCLGLERSNLSLLRGDSKLDAVLAQAMSSKQGSHEAAMRPERAGGLTWRWVSPQRSEVVLLGLWVIYVVAGTYSHYR
jgi:hypothetical protein